MSKITIIDYGIGNIFSVSRAFEHCGAEVQLTSDPEIIMSSERVLLPGVGAFMNGFKGLQSRGLVEPIKQYALSGRPFMGICLGMQMLFTTSLEFGTHEGLGLIPGTIKQIVPEPDQSGRMLKVPNVGWSRLVHAAGKNNWDNTVLADIGEDESCYFVHSYAAHPENQAHRLADTPYGKSVISAVVKNGNVYGCQFHPEKSGETGLKIVKGFLNA